MKRSVARGSSLVRRIHGPRIAGLLLGVICVGTVLHANQAPAWLWGLALAHLLVWPFVALWLGLSSRNPYRAVSVHLMVDITLVGIWMAAMQFNALASILLLAMVSMNNMAVGGPRLVMLGLVLAAAGAALGQAVLGRPVRLESTPIEVFAALPMLLVYPLVVGYECFRLDRRLAQHKRELALLSIQDGLTGLYNRGYWEAVLQARFLRACEGGPRPALMLIDLDRFKSINDTYGHVAGDAALRHVAACLKASVQPEDICARYGGDEFVVLVADADEPALRRTVDRLQALVDQPTAMPWLQAELGVSAGACLYADTLRDIDDWSRRADGALYEAKHGGRRRFVLASTAEAESVFGLSALPSSATR